MKPLSYPLFGRTRKALGVLAFQAALVTAASNASALVIDFDTLPAGAVVTSADLPTGYSIEALNKVDPSITDAIIFDSDCPGGCTGGDADLLTPGVGQGNDTAQHKILIVPEDLVDTSPPDGLIDDPDDEQGGGIIALSFPGPRRVLSIRIVDIDTNETGTIVVLSLSGGGTLELPVPTLGNNSAQTLDIPSPVPFVDKLTMDFRGSGAIDDIVIEGVCGDGVVDENLGEECDDAGANSDTIPDACRTDCTLPTCGDGVTDTGEQCDDGNTTPGDGCEPDCTFSRTTTTSITTTTEQVTTTTEQVTMTTEQVTTTTEQVTMTTESVTTTTEPITTTTEPVTTTSLSATTTTTIPVCGDGVQDTGEECDDGIDNSDTDPNACREDCTLPICGDGVIDAGEVCDPPNSPEICNNMIDDDDNGLQDCEDTGPCPIGVETCAADCTLAPPCVPVERDPAIIRFDTRHDGADYFSVHGNFVVDQILDLTTKRFGVRLSNVDGEIFQGTLAAAEFKRRAGGKGSYVFRDRAARKGGPGDADGFFSVAVRVRTVKDKFRYVFRVKAYGNFSAATESLMTLQVVAGEYVGVLSAQWTATRRGWILRLGDLN